MPSPHASTSITTSGTRHWSMPPRHSARSRHRSCAPSRATRAFRAAAAKYTTTTSVPARMPTSCSRRRSLTLGMRPPQVPSTATTTPTTSSTESCTGRRCPGAPARSTTRSMRRSSSTGPTRWLSIRSWRTNGNTPMPPRREATSMSSTPSSRLTRPSSCVPRQRSC